MAATQTKKETLARQKRGGGCDAEKRGRARKLEKGKRLRGRKRGDVYDAEKGRYAQGRKGKIRAS